MSTDEKIIGWRGFTAMCVIIVAVHILAAFVLYFAIGSWEERGAFGDMFGVVNSVFSGLAFVGVIYAILLQRHELMLQREELSMTRQELSRTAEAQERTTEIMERELKGNEVRDKTAVEPRICLSIDDVDSSSVILQIENRGPSAYTVSLLASDDDEGIEYLEDNEIPMLSSEKSRQIRCGLMNAAIGFEGTVTYEDGIRRQYHFSFTADFRQRTVTLGDVQAN